ncbi:putative nucleoside-diphosphate-sugar epimerase [Aspergillus affinis]|uniref:putative nucleoside-diphosphate-sugar epimerase n=1 Tax=Aspergillus affinis TaxID=1070780 RepID=UPI0022FE3CCD|nr:uncharacterized protein KD926_000957 [Aspergillus affinis]KAI9044356.1 hypothetical protein KD926_000957 [Aspergillus affinis]
MKVLIVGASGSIGSEALYQCLSHPLITSVVAFVRRDLSVEVTSNPKLETVKVNDFAMWPEDVLKKHMDAVGMIWAMGTSTGSMTADLEYPLIFIESMGKVSKSKPRAQRFRYVHLSGKFVRQNQDERLWFLEKPRKIKGLLETRALAFAEAHESVWQTFIVKPGGVVPRQIGAGGWLYMITPIGALLGENWSVKVQELGAFMTHLVIDGADEEAVSENARIVRKGRELLDERGGDSGS